MFTESQLHPYQRNAIDEMFERDRLIAVLPMGAGKTVVTLTALRDLLAEGVIKHVWVIAPLRVASLVWPDEPAKWEHLAGMTVEPVIGTPAQRRKAIARSAHVHTINFENLVWLEKEIGQFQPTDAIVIDESSRIKNPKGKRLKALEKMIEPTTIRYGLTGTPAPNGQADLFTQVKTIVGSAVWGRSFYAWRARYFRALDRQGWKWAILPGCDAIINAEFAKHSIKIDMNPSAPPTMLIDEVELPPCAASVYNELRDEFVAEVGDSVVIAETPAAKLMKLRQIAGGSVYTDDGTEALHTAKLDALQDIVEDAAEPVLVHYEFLSELDAMRAIWPDMPVLGAGTSNAETARIVKAWNEGKIPVLAGHHASMGHGLNLQDGGRRQVWFSLPWSLEGYEQTNARLARQGQKQAVYIHHLVARGTIDRTVLHALRTKSNVQDAVVASIRSV